MSTYKILEDGGFHCLECNSVSHNPNDAANHYCAYCHKFHEPRPAAIAYMLELTEEELALAIMALDVALMGRLKQADADVGQVWELLRKLERLRAGR